MTSLDVARREARGLNNSLRRMRRALRALEDDLGARTLEQFVLKPGEQIDGPILDFLRQAVAAHHQQEVVLIIQVRKHADKEHS